MNDRKIIYLIYNYERRIERQRESPSLFIFNADVGDM